MGMANDKGLLGKRSPDEVNRSPAPELVEEDIKPSSSASQPPPVFIEDVERDLDEGVDCVSMQRGCMGGFWRGGLRMVGRRCFIYPAVLPRSLSPECRELRRRLTDLVEGMEDLRRLL